MTGYLAEASLPELVVAASTEPPLDESSEARLMRRVEEGDREALDLLVIRSLRIAVDEAIRYRGLGVPQRRLVRVGVEALVAAAAAYRPDRDGLFSRFAGDRVRRVLSDDAKLS